MLETADRISLPQKIVHFVLATVSAAAMLILMPGCAVIKATQLPDKKDLSVLSQGVARTHVIAELGPPIWSEERDGVTTDVFAFKQGYSRQAKAGRAFVHGAADVLTGGLWEVVGTPAEALADGTDVKAEVTYDGNRQVRAIEVFRGQQALEHRTLWTSRPETTTQTSQRTPVDRLRASDINAKQP